MLSLALSVVEPHHSGIGEKPAFSPTAKGGPVFALDGRGTAPVQAGPDLFLKNWEVRDEWKDLGGQSVCNSRITENDGRHAGNDLAQ